MGLEKVGLKVIFKLTFTLDFSDIRWYIYIYIYIYISCKADFK